MLIERQKKSVNPQDISLTLKDIGAVIVELKKKNIPHDTIAKRIDVMFHAAFYLLNLVPAGRYYPTYIEELLDDFYKNPHHLENGKASRSLIKQIPNNDFLDRELTFIDNIILRDLSKFLKDNNLSSKIEGSDKGKITLALKTSERIQIANFLSAWVASFGSAASMLFNCEDINLRVPCMPPPDRFNPNIKKEKITPMFL